jgi:GWxTD domain-containing protein
MKHTRIFILLFSFLPLATGAPAQLNDAREAFASGIQSAQKGDTIGALAFMAEATTLDPSFAEAHFQRGLLQFRRSTKEGAFLDERLDAQRAFEDAIRYDPGNPRYWLELGKLLLMQEIRVDAGRVFGRALEFAERADAETLAEIHYQFALFKEVQWLRFRDRHRLPPGIDRLDAALAFADPRYVWNMLDRSSTWRGQGVQQRTEMVGHLDEALAAFPAHVGAASQLLAYLYDQRYLDEFMAEARRFARAAPIEPKAYLALGLGLHAMGREDEAAGAFQYAVELMPDAAAEEFLSVARLMTKKDAARYEDLTAEARSEARRRFWLASDPLFLTPSNEFRAEYVARMAYADLRFGVNEYKLPGWQTDKGAIWVRYGEPLRSASFSPNTGENAAADITLAGRITTVWTYGRRGPVFVFHQNPGYRRATFASDFRFYADDYRSMQPNRMTAPSLPTLIPMPAQLARFRGSGDAVALEVHAQFPLDSIGRVGSVVETTLEHGLFVVDEDGIEIRRVTEAESLEVGERARRTVRRWRTDVPPERAYLVAAEVRDPITWASAAHRTRIGGKSFPAGAPSMSDVLLANRVEPLVENPTQRHEFEMDVEPTLSFRRNQPIALYFELYNLAPDAEQFASYELRLAVYLQEIYRKGLLGQLAGGAGDALGLTDEGRQSVELEFGREERVLARDMIPEYLNITLDDASPGRYVVELVVTDRNAGTEMTTARTFEIPLPD